MKILVRMLLVVLGLGVAWWAMQTIAGETGEVVVVTTTSADGATADTRLWVVDHDGGVWLRAGTPGSGWFQEMLAEPSVTVVRSGLSATYEAVPDMSQQAAINNLMSDKYGWRESYISFFFPRDNSVPIRLAPAEGSGRTVE